MACETCPLSRKVKDNKLVVKDSGSVSGGTIFCTATWPYWERVPSGMSACTYNGTDPGVCSRHVMHTKGEGYHLITKRDPNIPIPTSPFPYL
jgi:hypothetical protein